LTPRAGACYPERVRALPSSISRAVVALLLLALCAAPLARATTALGAKPHGCCPEAPASPEPAPCQQIAPLSCCLEVGVPPTPGGPERPDDLALTLVPAPALDAFAPVQRCLAAPGSTGAPPLAPLAQSCVLLL
jgi:hypothetical protein